MAGLKLLASLQRSATWFGPLRALSTSPQVYRQTLPASGPAYRFVHQPSGLPVGGVDLLGRYWMMTQKYSESNKLFDQQYLKDEQYRTAANLEAWMRLHRDYGTNAYPWPRWVFDQLDLKRGMRILEVGCGPASLWQENLERIPAGVNILAGDLSLGMVESARNNMEPGSQLAAEEEFSLDWIEVDAQAIPLSAASFDLVVANHMLYHVPDMDRAVAEMRRVLKPGGRLIAATNGWGHMRQLNELLEANRPADPVAHRSQVRRFALENGSEILKQSFPNVEVHIYEDHLHVTQVEPVLDYILSLWDSVGSGETQALQAIADQVGAQIKTHGYFLINKSQGMLVASL